MDAYAAWAPTYPPHAHNALMEAEQAAMLDVLPPVSGRLVLDAGCGTGRYIQLLTALGARVVGVDRSAAMVTRARALSACVVRGDMARLPFADRAYDVVVSGLAVIDAPDLDPVVAEWSRVVCHRGVLVYSTLHPDGAALGWMRTFVAAGETRTLAAHWHPLADHRRACGNAGLEIEALEEPAVHRGGQAVALVVRARRHR